MVKYLDEAGLSQLISLIKSADAGLQGQIGTLNSLSTTAKTNLVVAINELAASAGLYKIVEKGSPNEGCLKSYELKKYSTPEAYGDDTAADINIPKDFLVKSATIETVETENTPVQGFAVGDKYIDFVINTKDTENGSADDEHLYLNVNDLVDVYTAGNGLSLSNTDEFSIKTPDTKDANDILTVGTNGVEAILPAATSNANGILGGVIVGTNINVSSGTISVDTADNDTLGLVKPDNETIVIDTSGVISLSPSVAIPTTSGDDSVTSLWENWEDTNSNQSSGEPELTP